MKTRLLGVSLLGVCLGLGLFWTLPASADDKDEPKDKKKEASSEAMKFEDKLTDADPKDSVQTDSPHKVHVVKLKAGQTYQIDLIRKDLTQKYDPFLRVEDADKKQLAEDDDGGDGLNSRIMLKVEKTGDYRIIATSLDGMGDYVLKIAPQAAVKVALKGGVNLGAVGAKGITTKGRVVQGAPAPHYQVKLVANKTYIIDMETDDEDFDPYLVLANPAGMKVEEDDDSGDNLNARIRYTAPADGEYVITARSFGGTVGPFTLKIREE